MKTLVIHPDDRTTDFLKVIYSNEPWTIINFNLSKNRLKQEIKAHDRIIMLGHGDGHGLYGFGRMVIDSNLVYLLREKECVCIWCNANFFAPIYKLKGFYTGMIVSDIEEAILYCVNFKHSSDIDESNKLFAESIKNGIILEPKLMLDKVKESYKSDDNNVIMFNMQNLYYCEPQQVET